MSDSKATCTFSAEDVVTVFDITLEKANEWLAGRAGRHMADRMCETGWETMETLGDMDGLPLVEEAQDE